MATTGEGLPSPAGRSTMPDMVLLVVAIAAGLLLDASVDGPPGLALGALGLLAAAATIVIGRPERRAVPFVAAAALLAPGFVLRASPWLHSASLLGIVTLLALGAGYARAGDPLATTTGGMLARGASVFASVPAGLAALVIPIGAPLRSRERSRALVRSLVVAVPFVVILVLLLGSADPVFARIAWTPLRSIPDSFLLHAFVIGVGMAAMATLLVRTRRAPDLAWAERALPAPVQAGPEGVVLLVVAAVVFLAFILVQAAVLFGGLRWLRAQEDLTLADYARQGFWHLLASAAIAGGVIAATQHLCRGAPEAVRRWFAPAASALVLLVLVVLASAFQRLVLYESAFGYTWPRLLGHTGKIFIAGLLVCALVGIVRDRFSRLPAATVALGVALLLGLHLLNPDAFIARRNLARVAEGHELDTRELGSLSADAWPVVVAALPTLDDCSAARLAEVLSYRLIPDIGAPWDPIVAAGGWGTWNAAEARGRAALEEADLQTYPRARRVCR